jgi:hypothetical protein
MKIILGCGAKKAPLAVPAWQLYTGSTFQLALAWARSIVPLRSIYILSAKHGLIHSMDVIAPYDSQMGTPSQIITVAKLAQQVADLGLDQEKPLLVNLGEPYRKVLEPALPRFERLIDHMDLPDNRFGYQRSWFKNNHRKLPARLHAIYI